MFSKLFSLRVGVISSSAFLLYHASDPLPCPSSHFFLNPFNNFFDNQSFSSKSLRDLIGSPNRDENNRKILLYSLIGANSFFYLASHNARLESLFNKHFCSSLFNISKGRIHTLLTNNFYHNTFLHIFANMYVLSSLMPAAFAICNRDPKEFLSFYIAGGVSGSLLSLTWRMITRSLSSSLGASASIYSLLFLVGLSAPEASLGIIFIPPELFNFNALRGLCAIFVFDLVGMLFFRRSGLDHAAHLGGALFGIGYYWYKSSDREKQRLKSSFNRHIVQGLSSNFPGSTNSF
eukprot:TRINITY_DN16219_c0_g1_i1.p1 TRINITY_DN16219_c0_g1~~TRINITY_DN16219_c0_g1_i1.p1  ORF type:complete len:291 (-),score=31.89 TRINITY_DN16219_c0_g1_i1:217-1089(-)